MDSNRLKVKTLKELLMETTSQYIHDLEAARTISEKKLSEYYSQKEAEKGKTNEPDEEGWMTVAPKSASRRARTSTAVAGKGAKSVGKPLSNFYSVQLKASKRQYLVDLRKKDIAAKKKIEELRKNRKFRPF